MAEFKEILKKFCDSFGRAGDDTGDMKFVENTHGTYPSSLPTCQALATFYQHLKLSHAGIGGSLMMDLYDIDQLEKSQIGWRWIRSKNGANEVNPAWSPNFVVIGDRNGDALAVDTTEASGPVHGFIQGTSILLSKSLQDFIDVYSDWMQCEFAEFKMDVKDDDFNLDPAFLDRLNKIAAAKLTGSEIHGLFEFYFG